MDFWIKAAQLITSLSILIVLHEMGHFLPAKLFKTRVEKFYLFFNPWFSLFKARIGETVYGIGWLPLGGYVKISGMIDESMDKEQMKKPPEPWEFRAKPTWQRLIIMVGGVTVNLFLGFFIYSLVLFTWGKDLLPNESMVHGMYADTLLHQYGFEDGDRILKLDTNSIHYFGDINAALLINGVREVTVERNGTQQTIPLPDTFAEVLLDSGVKVPLIPRIPWVIESTVANRPAANAGLLAGDKIIAINGEATPYFVEVRKAIRSSAGQTIAITVERAGATQTISVPVDTGGGIGIYRLSALDVLESEHRDYTLAESIPAGFTESIAKLTSYVRSMKLLFTKAGAKQIGGFGAIGSMFPAEWIWQDFWQFTAFLSLILAFMNILPIPALDGGHVMFLLYEMITGRPPGEKFLEYAQIAGMILLIALLLYANGNDIYRWLDQ